MYEPHMRRRIFVSLHFWPFRLSKDTGNMNSPVFLFWNIINLWLHLLNMQYSRYRIIHLSIICVGRHVLLCLAEGNIAVAVISSQQKCENNVVITNLHQEEQPVLLHQMN